METNNPQRGMGSRSVSLGTVLKEQRMQKASRGVPDVEYELGNGERNDGSGSEASEEASQRRVVMMYDENGNATPMPMAKFYYDNVQGGEDEDDYDDEGPSEQTRMKDTTRTNVPAPFENKPSATSSEEENGGNEDVDIDRDGGKNFVEDDDEYDELEDNEEDSSNDPFRNQFMRISIPATGLKDVKRVRKDLDHDKRNKRGALAGLSRAVSQMKIADGGRARGGAGPAMAKSGSGLGRMLSFNREKSSRSVHDSEKRETPQVSQPLVSTISSSDAPIVPVLERSRETSAAKPVKRQGLASVGRMLSISKQKTSSATSSTHGSLQMGSQDQSSIDRGDRDMPTGDRPRVSGSIGGSRPAGRASLSQIGRMLSINKKKNTSMSANQAEDRSGDGERRETEAAAPSGARKSLSRLGRVMSFKSSKATEPKGELRSISRPEELKISPMSTSTVSTSESVQEDGDRERPRGGNAGGGGRAKVKGVGRMLSFSRKADQRSRTVLQAEDKKEKQKRPQSVPASKTGSVDGGDESKLDGRGDKFFFSEINSKRVHQAEIMGEETHIRVPVIAMAEYSGPVSRSKWYVDAFTLPHNAVRRECIDLYDMLMALARCGGERDIGPDDMTDMERWWKIASAFFSMYFEMERRVLFPWVDSAGAQDWEVQLALKKMRSMKDKLHEQLGKIDRVWLEKTFKTVGDMYAMFYKAVDEFVPRLMNYFADQEVLLPAIVKGYYRIDDRLKMDKDMVAVFMGEALTRKNREMPKHGMILLVRWMGNARQLRAWIGKNLSGAARGMYPRWYAMWEEEHFSLVRAMRGRGKAILDVV